MLTTENALRKRRAADLTGLARVISVVALLVLAGAAAGRAIYYAVISFGVILWPFEVVGGEATMLHESQLPQH